MADLSLNESKLYCHQSFQNPLNKSSCPSIPTKCRWDAGGTTFGADQALCLGIRVDWISLSDSPFDDHYMGSKHFLRTPTLVTVFLLHGKQHNCD